ncbi:MAG: HAD family hydrolase [Verrucomicrobiaceae bacterium]
MIHGVLFDLDGTLVDSLPGITLALNRALEEQGLPPYSQKEVTGFIGNGAAALADKALGDRKDELGPLILAGFQNHYQDTWPTGTLIFPGIPELLKTLKQAGFTLGVLSNKPHPFTVQIIEELFDASLFDGIYGHQDSFPKKPDPAKSLQIASDWNVSPHEIAYVGDSDVDLATAQNAGMQPFIVNWGYGFPHGWPPIRTIAELSEALLASRT